MADRPILFSGAMVRAILAGNKTQTRRVVKIPGVMPRTAFPITSPDEEIIRFGDGTFHYLSTAAMSGPYPCPYGQPGDRLRVKEAAWMWCERRPNGTTKTGRQKWLYVPMREAQVHFAADHPAKPAVSVVSPGTGNQWGWRLKIGRFLPAWASRITLEITGVRVERLQDISEADARAEGISDGGCTNCGNPEPCGCADPAPDARDAFAGLWMSINGEASWHSNPWVWVVEFRRGA